MTDKLLTRDTIKELLEFPALQKLDNWKHVARTALALMDERDRLNKHVAASNANRLSLHNAINLIRQEVEEHGPVIAGEYTIPEIETEAQAIVEGIANAIQKRETERNALAAAEAELREAAIIHDYSDEAAWSKCVWGCQGPAGGPVKHNEDCPLAAPANERGEELLEKARRADWLLGAWKELKAKAEFGIEQLNKPNTISRSSFTLYKMMLNAAEAALRGEQESST